jgi:hypothetical protein
LIDGWIGSCQPNRSNYNTAAYTIPGNISDTASKVGFIFNMSDFLPVFRIRMLFDRWHIAAILATLSRHATIGEVEAES